MNAPKITPSEIRHQKMINREMTTNILSGIGTTASATNLSIL